MRGSRPLNRQEYYTASALLSGKMAMRNRAMFSLGVNAGFRVTEITSLKIGDLVERDGSIVDRVTVSRLNMKGKKNSRTIRLNNKAKAAIRPWLESLAKQNVVNKNDYVFRSIRGNYPVCRSQAWKILAHAYRVAGFKGKLGTHAMRKTFANNVYDYFLGLVAAGEKIDAFRLTSKALGHSDIKSTDQYLSFRTEEIDRAVDVVGI